jgi:hypothetical protein
MAEETVGRVTEADLQRCLTFATNFPGLGVRVRAKGEGEGAEGGFVMCAVECCLVV